MPLYILHCCNWNKQIFMRFQFTACRRDILLKVICGVLNSFSFETAKDGSRAGDKQINRYSKWTPTGFTVYCSKLFCTRLTFSWFCLIYHKIFRICKPLCFYHTQPAQFSENRERDFSKTLNMVAVNWWYRSLWYYCLRKVLLTWHDRLLLTDWSSDRRDFENWRCIWRRLQFAFALSKNRVFKQIFQTTVCCHVLREIR